MVVAVIAIVIPELLSKFQVNKKCPKNLFRE